jgi:hypothetical protein
MISNRFSQSPGTFQLCAIGIRIEQPQGFWAQNSNNLLPTNAAWINGSIPKNYELSGFTKKKTWKNIKKKYHFKLKF